VGKFQRTLLLAGIRGKCLVRLILFRPQLQIVICAFIDLDRVMQEVQQLISESLQLEIIRFLFNHSDTSRLITA
jgi:hypothetical protein